MPLPKLHLRDLFWLMLVCACLCGWWVRERDYRALQDKAAHLAFDLEIAKEASKFEEIQLDLVRELRRISDR